MIRIAAVTALLLATPALAQEQALKVDLLGSLTLPTGLLIEGVEFGGISGLDYDPEADLYYAISDDRSQKAPARYYTLKLKIDAEGLHAVDIASMTILRDAAGNAFPNGGIDPEAIRFNAAQNSIFWTTENDVVGNPGVYESRLDGTFLRAFAVPDYFNPTPDQTRGVYGNLGFEGLTLAADGASLWVSTENGLVQDGAKATLEAGSPVRLLQFDIASGAAMAEHIYETGPIHAKATAEPPYNDNGVSEILTFDDSRLLVIERSFAAGLGNEIKFFLTDLAGATDVAGRATIADEDFAAATAEPAFVLAEGDFGLDIDNIESVTFGPEVDGQKTVVIASDNNFNASGQFTQFVVFTIAD